MTSKLESLGGQMVRFSRGGFMGAPRTWRDVVYVPINGSPYDTHYNKAVFFFCPPGTHEHRLFRDSMVGFPPQEWHCRLLDDADLPPWIEIITDRTDRQRLAQSILRHANEQLGRGHLLCQNNSLSAEDIEALEKMA